VIIQGHRKVMQPVLKCLLSVEIQYNSIELINTQLPHVGHIMLLPARANSSVVFLTVKLQGFVSTSVASVHCQTSPGISSLLYLPEWVYECISRFSCAKQTDNISSNAPLLSQQKPRTGLHQTGGKGVMYLWTRWTLPTLTSHCFLFSLQRDFFWQTEHGSGRNCVIFYRPM
jgi:hypothetical protein